MEPYQERVMTEQKELAEKIVKLTQFISDQGIVKMLKDTDWNLLYKQLETMNEYNRILILRILAF